MPCRAAVHSAWMVYMDPPSPVKPTTVRSGNASWAPSAPGIPTPREPPRVWNQWPGRFGGRCRETSGEAVSASSNTTASSGSWRASSRRKAVVGRAVGAVVASSTCLASSISRARSTDLRRSHSNARTWLSSLIRA